MSAPEAFVYCTPVLVVCFVTHKIRNPSFSAMMNRLAKLHSDRGRRVAGATKKEFCFDSRENAGPLEIRFSADSRTSLFPSEQWTNIWSITARR
jgi:hypothetical protein